MRMKLHTLPPLPPQVINPNQRLCPSIRAVQYPRRANRQPLARESDPAHVVDAQELLPRLRVAAEVPGRMCHRRRLRRLSRLGFGRCSRVLTPSILESGRKHLLGDFVGLRRRSVCRNGNRRGRSSMLIREVAFWSEVFIYHVRCRSKY